MSTAIGDRLRAVLGTSQVDRAPDGAPRATPASTEAVALVCRLAREERWRIRVEGRGTWLPVDAPADLALSTRGLDRIVTVSPADLVATVQAGVPLDGFTAQLAEQRMWLALDPPGRPDRSLGSVAATATSGALRAGFGPVRDHILGCTVVTGDGRIIQVGGRVVKNVAGYDITKLQVGGFGGFGILTELHLRLRAQPERDVTMVARGERETLARAAREARGTECSPAALELLSPALGSGTQWLLGARSIGTSDGVRAEVERLQRATELLWEELPAERSGGFWRLTGRGALSAPVSLRLGVLPEGVDEALDLVIEQLGEGLIAAGMTSGSLRWSGDAPGERLVALRRTLAAREIPLTLERAPWAIRRAVGHFGSYREGVGQLVSRLRESFDPAGSLQVALEGVLRG